NASVGCGDHFVREPARAADAVARQLSRRPAPPSGPLTAAGMHLQVWIALQLADLNERPTLAHRETLFRAAVGAHSPRRRDHTLQRPPARAAEQSPTEIDALRGVEAEVPEAVRGQPAPVAHATERARGGRDDAERRAIAKPEAIGRRRTLLHDGLDAAV